jgi:putative membrane protein
MEFKLANVIMRPAMHATWTFGLLLVFTPGIVDWTAVWPYTKAFCVILMTLFHTWLVIRMKAFQRGENHITGRQYRMMNEVPTVLLIVIVISVVVKF